MDPFSAVHRVANAYYHNHCNDTRDFTHYAGSNNDNLIACFYLKYNKSDLVDVKKEIDTLNKLLSSHDANNFWCKIEFYSISVGERPRFLLYLCFKIFRKCLQAILR